MPEEEKKYASLDDFDEIEVTEASSSEDNREEEVNEVENVIETDNTEENEEDNNIEETEDNSDNRDEEEQTEEVTDNNEEQTEEDSVEDEDVDYSELVEASGYEINSYEDAVSAFEELNQELNELKANPYKDLPKEAQLVLNAISNKENYKSKLRLLSLDTDGIEGKDALKESFLLKSGEKMSKELAEMQFERDYDNKYGILDKLSKITDPEEKAEFESENAGDIKFAKALLEQDTKDAKEGISKFIEENTTPVAEDNSISVEEQEQLYQDHLGKVNSVYDNFTGISLPLDENGDNSFHLGLSDSEKGLLKDTLANPVEFFRESVGIDLTTGQITDYDSLASIFTIVQNSDKLVSVLGQYYMEQNDKKSIQDIVENREAPKQGNSKPQTIEKGGIDLSFDDDF